MAGDELQAAPTARPAKIDPLTGSAATSDKLAVDEWFISGTEPKSTLP